MIEHKRFTNGFEYLEVTNKKAEARIALQGAHLFHYRQQNREPLIWLSRSSHFTLGKAIRGGIPICWPWFGRHKDDSSLPQHGFARTATWELIKTREEDDLATELTLQLKDNDESMTLWPYKFKLTLRLLITDSLTLSLTSKNCDSVSFALSSALHSYFAVSDISNVSIHGLDKTPYLDTLNMHTETQKGDIVINQETDRIYQDVMGPIQLHDGRRMIRIEGTGSRSAVIWNPWLEKSRGMADMDDNAYREMLCIETANALEDTRLLTAGEEHSLGVTVA